VMTDRPRKPTASELEHVAIEPATNRHHRACSLLI
jgi:hypothetical protein